MKLNRLSTDYEMLLKGMVFIDIWQDNKCKLYFFMNKDL